MGLKREYVDIGGDLVTGSLLSQLVYWHLPDGNGQRKLRVNHDGHQWVAKTRQEWMTECRISHREYRRALETLMTKELVVVQVRRFKGSPTTHMRLQFDRLLQLIAETKALWSKCPHRYGQNDHNEMVGMSKTESHGVQIEMVKTAISLTKNTAKTTGEITSETVFASLTLPHQEYIPTGSTEDGDNREKEKDKGGGNQLQARDIMEKMNREKQGSKLACRWRDWVHDAGYTESQAIRLREQAQLKMLAKNLDCHVLSPLLKSDFY